MAMTVRQRVANHRAKKNMLQHRGTDDLFPDTLNKVIHMNASQPDPETPEDSKPDMAEDMAQAIAEWSRSTLVVPPGHPLEGQPLIVPDYALDFLHAALQPGIREALLSVGRKNAKSAIVAVVLLAFLVGPLKRKGWRAGVASVTKEKATELWSQAEDIALASKLEGLKFGKCPRKIESDYGKADFLSADKNAGHASGFDLVIVDEMGLFPETGKINGRKLVSGLLSSTSAKNGRMIAISILGDSPLTHEMVRRADEPSTVVSLYQAPKKCKLEDPKAWHAANPGIAAGIKSLSYMQDMARRAATSPNEQTDFRAFDLNQPGATKAGIIVDMALYRACSEQQKPERKGQCFLGFDIGGSASMTAAAAYWPATHRLDVWGAFGDKPTLKARGETDGVGERYLRMEERGELRTFPGRVTPVTDFLKWVVLECLADVQIVMAAADRYRKSETEDYLEDASLQLPMEWRAQGLGPDGSEDVRAFQRTVVGGRLRPGESLLLESAIGESMLRYDGNGNPALDKARANGRIDPLASGVLAVGLGSRKVKTSQLYVV